MFIEYLESPAEAQRESHPKISLPMNLIDNEDSSQTDKKYRIQESSLRRRNIDISVVGLISTIGRIVRFAKKIKKKVSYSNISNLNKKQLEILADKAFSDEAHLDHPGTGLHEV